MGSRRNFVKGAVAALIMAAGTFSSSLFAAQHSQADELKLAFIPQENPEKLLGDIKVITKWLSDQTGVEVKGFVTIDHAAAVEALRNGDADISFMGALPFVLAEKEIGAKPLLSEIYKGAASYTGRIFVRKDSGIKSLADLKGKTIAFADPISESGYMYPLNLFVEAGLFAEPSDAGNFFDRSYFAGGYQQSMQAMAAGLVDAAGSSQYADLLLTPQQQSEVISIAESEPIPSHMVIARNGLDAGLEAKFVEAMLALNTAENKQYLAYIYGPEGYVKSNTDDYDGVRALARRYGLMK
ncbi:Phosphate-import protein PhnD precursor [Pseudovibrio axinellae]|uniref:Phosphate-import protein PhnD n=1 Tax=Pseudovibrio axinellae TaxID=989403 RepID=A0A166BDI0_9HYPH|nr:phosphate/phosphite/phosphonate ABC transporter substrate-binding protein [Pseudovibrio axinellae]KZL22153.1 Phosphate-import protein PhnD precursor [Pseudovibrio axinellae]SEQ53214.1 phosphonate transport system substrate-binding protein [Pseudovibrio axinellae]